MTGSKKHNVWAIRVTTQEVINVMDMFNTFNVVIRKKDIIVHATMIAWVVEKEYTSNRHYHVVVEYENSITKNHLDKFLNKIFGEGNEKHSSKSCYDQEKFLRYMSKENMLYGLWRQCGVGKSIQDYYNEQKLLYKDYQNSVKKRENLMVTVQNLFNEKYQDLDYVMSRNTVPELKLKILEVYMEYHKENDLSIKAKMFVRNDIDNLYFKLIPCENNAYHKWLKSFLD